ncbi:unnamed protein product, partial [Hapterophycus canaliculatus]
MHQGYDGHSRRRKRSLCSESLTRSQSLNAISKQPLRRELRSSGGRSGSANNLPASQYLPPIGGEARRYSDKQQQRQLTNGEDPRHVLGRSSSWSPALDPAEWSPEGPVVVPALGWTHFADVFVQAGQAAGIAFQWTETETTTPAAGAPAILGALSVLGVVDGSLAARHGGISPGMMLVEISGERIAGMSQDKIMRLMRKLVSQPRVLTLARIVGQTPPPPSPPPHADTSSNCSAEALPEEMETNLVEGEPGSHQCTSAASRVVVKAKMQTTPITFSRLSRKTSRLHSPALSTKDANGGNAPSEGSRGSALFGPLCASNSNTQVLNGSSVPHQSWENIYRPPRAQTSTYPHRLIALRFVGSRGNTSLFDRDHVLGVKVRDIEFVQTRTYVGEESSHSSRLAEEHRRANSKRSLEDLTRDWRNDPFSTPARRRRLINDACKVIVRSYTHASVSRVAELRREEFFIVRIQAGCRMRQARRLFCARLANRRAKAASVLQLGWLSCVARRRTRVRRAEKDRNRYIEDMRARREAHARKERRNREEEEREIREKDKTDRRNLCRVVFVQKRFRAQREARRRLAQDAERLQAEQWKKAVASLRAVVTIQTAFRRLKHKRRQLQTVRTQQDRLHRKVDVEGRASIRLQAYWRRYVAIKALDRLRRDKVAASTFLLLTDEKTARNSIGPLTDLVGGDYHPLGGAFSSTNKDTRDLLDREESEDVQGEASSLQGCSPALRVKSSLAVEIAQTQMNTAGVQNPRPWTAAGAVEQSTAMTQVGRAHGPRLPPAGMMTVTVRRGLEETNLVTPIVLTESGSEGEARTATPSPDFEWAPSAATAATGPSSGIAGSRIVGSGSHAGRDKQKVMDNAEVGSAVRVPFTDVVPEDMISFGRKDGNPTVAATIALVSNHSVTRKSLPSASPTIIGPANDGTTVPPPTKGPMGTATTAAVPRAAASDDGRQLASVTPTSKVVEEADRVVIKPTEQLFMEDTQLYLGCTACGVKYLVEAVDTGTAKLMKAGQPAPEVLYLCTTCGGTLRNNGDDGRWRRRRRPSSAPAAGCQRGSPFFFNNGGSDSGATKSDIIGLATAKGLKDSTSDHAATEFLNPVNISQQLLLAAGGTGTGGGNFSVTRLRYAVCARRIQHAYQDFRHRQYLRDWAFSLVRRQRDCSALALVVRP